LRLIFEILQTRVSALIHRCQCEIRKFFDCRRRQEVFDLEQFSGKARHDFKGEYPCGAPGFFPEIMREKFPFRWLPRGNGYRNGLFSAGRNITRRAQAAAGELRV
jgi:hypothetical protein